MAAISAHRGPGSMSFTSDELAMTSGSGSHSLPADASVPRSSGSDTTTSPLNSPNRPEPLPAFVFPMRPPPSSPSPRSIQGFPRAAGRRPKSAVELSGARQAEDGAETTRATLPDFTFGSSLQSPPISPRTIPPRSNFHKRGTSEFIGGDGTTGTGELLSTSPTKGENGLPLPHIALGPPGGRRGHAHRRSAAISCHDLSMILKPDPKTVKGGASAPTSPSVESHGAPPFPASLDSAINTANFERDPASVPPARAFNRNRVGFSDFVDIIPRPLSLVSSDSSSTVRQGHSVTGSMSSIISAGTSSPQPKEKHTSSTLSSPQADTRPRTAETFMEFGASKGSDALKRRNSIPLLVEAATNAPLTPVPSTPRSLKKWAFFGHDSASGESSPKSRPTSSASTDKTKTATSPSTAGGLSSANVAIPSTEIRPRRSDSLTRKPTKKPKKVRSWAGSILSRKSRQRSQKQKLSRRSPTPPLRSFTPLNETIAYEFQQAEPQVHTTYTGPSAAEVHTDIASWKPRKTAVQEENTSPIIDLDAALGPFNTPTSFGEDWDASQRGGNRKRAMHSAAGLGNFSGPGGHYHRRAESAPEFENPRFRLNRLASNSTMGMEDVFEEENEDDEDWEDTKTSEKDSRKGSRDDGSTGLGIDIKVVDSEGMEADNPMDFEEGSFERGVTRKGSWLSDGDRRTVSSSKSEHSNRSIIDEPIMEESSPVEIADDSIPPRSESGSRSSDSTATPPLRPAAKELAPVEIQPFTLQPSYLSPTSPHSTTQSSFPSPRSPYSYDAQRISTAPSSVTDEQGFQSLLLGEPGPEVRMSVDDVPSLTSSNSTMTRDSGYPAAMNNPQLRDGQRSSSLSSAAVSRKRSSMASLSRLMSSHGEKSKLSIESRPNTSEGLEKKDKEGRGKRISRMMQFWKPKDS